MSILTFLAIFGALGAIYCVANKRFPVFPKSKKDNDEHMENFVVKKVDGTIQTIHVPKSVARTTEEPRSRKAKVPPTVDALMRYKRRYGLCGHFSRRVRKERRAHAKRALDEAIRRQDTVRLGILREIGIC